MLAPTKHGREESKIPVVLKRLSSPLNSHAAAVIALSPTVDARALGSAAMDASHDGADHTAAFSF